MNTVVEILREKNQLLEKFYRLNEEELLSFSDGDFDHLDCFYHSRETILEMVGRLDKRIGEISIESDIGIVEDCSPKTKGEVIKELDYKNDLVTRILGQDLQVLSFIESEKSNIILELSKVRSAKKGIRGYQSKKSTHEVKEEL